MEPHILHSYCNSSNWQEAYKELKYEVPSGKGFITALVSSSPSIVEEEFPLHDSEQVADLSRMLKLSFLPLKGIDVDKIRNYFGIT